MAKRLGSEPGDFVGSTPTYTTMKKASKTDVLKSLVKLSGAINKVHAKLLEQDLDDDYYRYLNEIAESHELAWKSTFRHLNKIRDKK